MIRAIRALLRRPKPQRPAPAMFRGRPLDELGHVMPTPDRPDDRHSPGWWQAEPFGATPPLTRQGGPS